MLPQIILIADADIIIKSNRQRDDIDQSYIMELATSIEDNSLLHPPVVRVVDETFVLTVGECRIRALRHMWFKNKEVRCAGQIIPQGFVPCFNLGDLDPIDAEQAELEENIRRKDLTWQQRSNATTRLADLRARQAALLGKPFPTVASITRELRPEATQGKLSSEFGSAVSNVKTDILLGNALKDPKKAAVIGSAATRKEAVKLLRRHEETERNAALGRAVGSTFNASVHQLLKGDCLQVLGTLPEASFDVICTDPPYGIDAQDFGTSDGKTAGGHLYDDSREDFNTNAIRWIEAVTRIAKPQSHIYWFCDVEWFERLKAEFACREWEVFRTPLIWVNPTAMRAPWPENGPQRKWQMILYAMRGKKQVTRLYSDVLTYPSDPNLGHQAQKPVALYEDLIRRSVRPGDAILDPFCGTGPIFPAAHKFQCRATGIEKLDAAFGIATTRLGELK